MQIVNNYNIEYKRNGKYGDTEEGTGVYNGDIGTIINIVPNSFETTVEFDDGKVCVYPKNELHQITLAYAITIHKSQGSEFDAVVIPVVSGAYMVMTRNLLYTAVTRAKRLVMLVGKQENIQKMVNNTFTKKRNSCLNKYLQYFKDMPY